MNVDLLIDYSESLGFRFIHRFDAKELEAAAGATFDHLDGERRFPSVRRAEDAEHGVETSCQSGGGSGIRLVVGGHDDDAHGVGDFACLVVGHLYSLCDGIHHVQRFVQVFVHLFGILKCGVELDLAFAGRSVDKVLDGAELGVFGVECDECGVIIFHVDHVPCCLLLFLFPRLLCLNLLYHMPSLFSTSACCFFVCSSGFHFCGSSKVACL